MLRKPGRWAAEGLVVPSERTIDRILHRQGLLRARPRKRPKDSFVRFERPGPMQMWQMDIVGGVRLVNPMTEELREAKVVTAVDDHSRYCVIAKVAERATGRVVYLALAEALARFGCRRKSARTFKLGDVCGRRPLSGRRCEASVGRRLPLVVADRSKRAPRVTSCLLITGRAGHRRGWPGPVENPVTGSVPDPC